MLKIMYALITYDDLVYSHGISGLSEKSYDHHAILKVHFVAETDKGIIFSALVDDSKSLHFKSLSTPLVNVSYRIIRNRKPPRHPVSPSLKSMRKYRRTMKNLMMTEKNWKQFIDPKNCILSQCYY
ncbi:hypothetical protein [Photobacterium indicum]|jgi:hypothetical protein|uniref:hypothetical protein n=1 Tax=Photobacterium indicum TaxID=81447 RepID=UPI003D11E8C6